MPYPSPPTGRPLRLAFVGERSPFEVCALGDERPDFRTSFVEFRPHDDAGRLQSELAAFHPDAVVVFRPEIIPAGTFAGLRAPTLGFVTDPLARDPGRDDRDFDRIVSVDPIPADGAEPIPSVWRSVPLPVSDRLFRPVAPIAGRPRMLFVGHVTPHSEQMLAAVKADHPDLVHSSAGLDAAALGEVMANHDVGINLHDDASASFENRVCLHLAAGHLVLSEPLSPQHGLERGIDYLEVAHGGAISGLLERLVRFPRTWHRVRVRGRLKAEQFRASRVWPRLVHDLGADLAAFGTRRVVR